MGFSEDNISKAILSILNQSDEPYETKEILELTEKFISGVTRVKLLYRLNLLRAESQIKGKFVGPGKGVWIWWKIDKFKKDIKGSRI